MADDLRIRIKSTLNKATSISEINRVLGQIEKDPALKKLNINISVSDTQIANISRQITRIQEQLKSNPLKIVPESNFKEFYTSIDKAIEKYKQLGTVKISRDSINPLTNDVEKFTLTVDKGAGVVEKFKFQLASLKNIQIGGNSNAYIPQKFSSVDNTQAVQIRQNEQLAIAQGKVTQSLTKMYNQGKVNESFFRNFNKVINSTKNVEEINKVSQALQRVSDYSKNINLKQNLLTNAQDLLGSNARNLDVTGVTNLINSLKNIKPNASTATNELTRLQTQLREYSNNAEVAHQHTLTLGSALQQAFSKFPIWMLASASFFAPIHALEDMSQRLIQIDTQMTDIKRVMDAPSFTFTQMLGDAVNMSDQLSSKLTDVLSIMDTFARTGYSGSQLTDITKTAQVLQNISDLNAQDSVNALVSAMINFNIQGSDSIKIADKLNEVDNHYAITTQDLAQGILKAGAVAKTFGINLDELNGYIAAIGRNYITAA